MASKAFQVALDAATNENNTEENWDRILEVCDYVKNGQIKPNELLDQILKRLKQTRRTKLQMNTLVLFDAAVKNCGQQFHLLFTSRATMNTLVEVIDDARTENTVRLRIGALLKQWMEDPEFKDKAQYAMLGATYKRLTTEKGYAFLDGPTAASNVSAQSTVSKKTQEELLAKKEEEDFAKAIALSMQDTNQSRPLQQQQQQTQQQPVNNSLYPTMQQSTSTSNSTGNEKKVKALYDFEAAEDNEVTFKAGDILIITDDSDQHWWKGINNGVEGLFPANFVTKNLQQQIDVPNQSTSSTNDTNQKQQRSNEIIKDQVVIDERLIDRCLGMLQNADPTGEIEPDSNEMLMLEDTCYAMGPLIDHELEKVDRKHVQLEELNKNLREAMDLYHRLMEEGRIRAAQAKTNAAQLVTQMYQQPQVPSQPYYQVHPGLQAQQQQPLAPPPPTQQPPQQQQQPPMMYQPQPQVYNQMPPQTQPSMPYIPQQAPLGAYYVDPNLQQQPPMMYSMPPNMMNHYQPQQPTAHSETQ